MVGPAAPDLAAVPARHPVPPTASILPGPLVGHESQADEPGPPEAAEPVVRKIRASHRRTGPDSGGPDVGSRRQSIRPKSEPSESTRGPRARTRPGIGNSAALRERTTTYKVAIKDSGLKVETDPLPPTGPNFGESTDRGAPTGSGKSPKPSGGETGGHQSERLQAGPEPETRSDDLGPSGRDGTQGPIGAGPRSEHGVDPLSARPIEDLQPAPLAPQRGTRSRRDAHPAVTQTTSATPESRPKAPVGSQAAVVPSPLSEVRQSVARQDRDRGPRVEIGSVDVQVVMDSPEPATEKVTSRPQPYIGSSRASRLYQRRL